MSSPFRHRIGSASSVSTGCGGGSGGGSLGADPPNPSPSPIRDFLRQDPIFSAIPPPPLPPPPSFPLGLGRNTRDLRTDPKRSCIFVCRCRYSAAARGCCFCWRISGPSFGSHPRNGAEVDGDGDREREGATGIEEQGVIDNGRRQRERDGEGVGGPFQKLCGLKYQNAPS